MASGTFYLRPSEDISIEHNLIPAESASAYLLINEEVADDDSTYIISQQKNDAMVYTSKFKLGGSIPTVASEIKITDITLTARGFNGVSTAGSIEVNIAINDVSIANIANIGGLSSWETVTANASESSLSVINNYIKERGIAGIKDIVLTIVDSHKEKGDDKTNGNKRITQVYVTVNYDTSTGNGIHRKVNGVWKEAKQAFRKVNGDWLEITEDECKSILQSSFCTK